jgi:hypothetical protein
MIPKSYSVRKINSKVGREFISQNHYTKGCHNGPMCYGLFDGETLIGVCAFATPCSENVRSSIWGKEFKDSVTELHRLFIKDCTPKNTESWFVSRVLKLLKEDKPNINGVVSFADATQGHKGTIYQALNAIYYGVSGKATFYEDTTGRLRHPRQNGENISKEDAKKRGWKPVKRDGKYRYLFVLPGSKKQKKNLINSLKIIKMEYPKND